MRIKKFQIKNFKSFGPVSQEFDLSENIITMIGPNNCGKTSVIEALNFFFSGTKTIPSDYFHEKLDDETHAIVITVTFTDLTDEDKNHQAVSPYISGEGSVDEIWVLKKQYFHEAGKGKATYVAIKDGDENVNPAGLTTNADDLFTDEKMQKIYLGAVKEVGEVVDSKKKSPLSQVFQLLLSSELAATDEHRELIDALRRYAQMFDPATKHARVVEIEQLISNKIKRMVSASGLIDVDLIDDEQILPTPNLQIVDGLNIITKPEFQGHGVQRSIIFALLELYAETLSNPAKNLGVTNLILIEEPEMYMHPQMEDRVADVLYLLAESGTVQIVCTTHSPKFIRMFEKQKTLVRLKRDGAPTIASQITTELFPAGSEENLRLRSIMNFDVSARECFFADRVVLVEGETEFVGIPYAAELMNVFSNQTNQEKKRGTTIINCRGRDSIPAFQKVLNHFGIDYVVVHDLEGEAKNTGVNNSILDLLGNDEARRLTCPNKFESDILGIAGKWYPAYKEISRLNSAGTLSTVMSNYVNFVYDINP